MRGIDLRFQRILGLRLYHMSTSVQVLTASGISHGCISGSNYTALHYLYPFVYWGELERLSFADNIAKVVLLLSTFFHLICNILLFTGKETGEKTNEQMGNRTIFFKFIVYLFVCISVILE